MEPQVPEESHLLAAASRVPEESRVRAAQRAAYLVPRARLYADDFVVQRVDRHLEAWIDKHDKSRWTLISLWAVILSTVLMPSLFALTVMENPCETEAFEVTALPKVGLGSGDGSGESATRREAMRKFGTVCVPYRFLTSTSGLHVGIGLFAMFVLQVGLRSAVFRCALGRCCCCRCACCPSGCGRLLRALQVANGSLVNLVLPMLPRIPYRSCEVLKVCSWELDALDTVLNITVVILVEFAGLGVYIAYHQESVQPVVLCLLSGYLLVTTFLKVANIILGATEKRRIVLEREMENWAPKKSPDLRGMLMKLHTHVGDTFAVSLAELAACQELMGEVDTNPDEEEATGVFDPASGRFALERDWCALPPPRYVYITDTNEMVDVYVCEIECLDGPNSDHVP